MGNERHALREGFNEKMIDFISCANARTDKAAGDIRKSMEDQTMKLFISKRMITHEEFEIIGVFESSQEAQGAIDNDLRADGGKASDRCEIEEFRLGEAKEHFSHRAARDRRARRTNL